MKDKTFVRDVADRFGCDQRRAETLIFAVFQELRDRLTPHARRSSGCGCSTTYLAEDALVVFRLPRPPGQASA
jgi:hypothetical protein